MNDKLRESLKNLMTSHSSSGAHDNRYYTKEEMKNNLGDYLLLTGGYLTGELSLAPNMNEDSYTGALNMKNSNIYGINALYTQNIAESAGKGIHFFRDDAHVDTFWVANGNMYFVPNRELGENTGESDSNVILHSGNYKTYCTPENTGSLPNTTNYAGSSSVGGSANSLVYFKCTSSSDVGIDDVSANAIGYVSGLTGVSPSSGAIYKQVYNTNYAHEILGDYGTGQLAVRGKNNGVWQSWRTVLDSANYKTYCTPNLIGAATDDHTHNYAGSSSTGGPADSAIKLSTARIINGTSFDGSVDITTANWGTARDMAISDSDGTNTGSSVSVNGSKAVILKLPSTIKATLSGNASTATKLATARTIALTGSVTGSGTFDGSGNLSIATTTNHTHNYAGSSSSGGSATSAISVVDYADSSKTIKIGWAGAGATTSNLAYIAGYLTGGTQIKDVSKDTLKSWLGLGSAAYTNSDAYATTNHTHSYAGSSSAGGAANSAIKLATARTIALTGSVTGSGTFDGSGNLSITTTTNHTHSYLPLSGGTLTGNLTVTGSTSMGDNCIASGKYSHAEGYKTTASGNESHAEGCYTLASGNYSHVDGYRTTASGSYSHAEGYYTIASGDSSHAEGSMTTASGNESHAEGHSTIALAYQHAEGHYNNTSTATSGAYYGSGTGTSFVIGNGGPGGPSNAFRVNDNGAPYSKSALVTTGCDYAEFFEWEDGNPNNEDRRGYFITTVGKKIKIAEPTDWVLGLTSGFPSIIGNGDEEWRGRYIFDNFGCPVIEEFTYEIEEYDEETEEMIMVEKTGTKWKENPDYDPTQQYIERTERQEWSASGLLGVLSVRDDGTCEVDGFCKVAEGGTATYADWSEGSYQHPVYRVVNRVTDNIVEILFR